MAVLPLFSPLSSTSDTKQRGCLHEKTGIEDNKGHPRLLSLHEQQPQRSRGSVISPLHRSILYLVLAIALHSLVALKKLHLTQFLWAARYYQPSQLQQSQRPVLYLHVGPKKTASTTIQLQVLANPVIVQAFKLDNVTIGSMAFNYRKVQRLRDECLLRPRRCHTNILDKFLDDMMVDYPTHDLSWKVVKSCETYSNLPRNAFTERVFRALSRKWHVKVVLVYRRASAWLPSAYYQRRKGNLFYSQGGGRYQPYQTGLNDPIAALPMVYFMEEMMQLDFCGDSLSTYQYFSSIYGIDNVIVVDMDSPKGVAADFVCRGLNATNACQVIQNQTIPVVNDNSQFLFDYDLLVMHAHQQGWLGSSSSNNITNSTNMNTLYHNYTTVERHAATKVVQKRMNLLNWTLLDLPRACLNPRQEEVLWNRTLEYEQLLARKPRSVDTLRQVFFEKDRAKFCTVDPVAVWGNSTLRAALFGDPCWFAADPLQQACVVDTS